MDSRVLEERINDWLNETDMPATSIKEIRQSATQHTLYVTIWYSL